VGVVVPGWSGPTGPAALPALEELLSLAARDHDVRVVAIRHPADRATYRDAAGIEVSALGMGRRGGPVGRAAAIAAGVATIRRLHADRPFDVLHAFWADEPGMIAVLAGRALGRRAIVSVMGGELVGLPDIGYGAQLGRGGRIATRVALGRADLLTAGSTTLYAALTETVPDRPLRLLPLGVDLARFRPASAAVPGPPRLLFAGSLVPVKDPVLALRSFGRLGAAGSVLEIAGDGPLRQDLGRVAHALGIADRVGFLGSLDRASLAARMQAADVLVVTSSHEAQSMVAVEAAACGLPVAGVAVGVVPELARAGGAILATDRTPSAIAEAIASALAGRDGLGAAARRHAEHAWDLGRALDRVQRAWQEPGATRVAT
jgi:glycosyltransferase involved in cell wall biosynthesis